MNFIPTKDYRMILCKENDRFTDDTVCTAAVSADLHDEVPFEESLRCYCSIYPKVGYGGSFWKWWQSDDMPAYNSWGNGSAMRVSAVGAYEAIEYAKKSAEVTHNHPEGIKGAQAIAAAIFLAKTGKSKEEIANFITETFNYNLDRKLENIKLDYKFEVSCQKSVPESIICFLESVDYESAIRNAISMGGDADTMACMCGGIASAYYKHIPEEYLNHMKDKLTIELLSIL